MSAANLSPVAAQSTGCRQPWIPANAPAFCPWQAEPQLPEPRSYPAVVTTGTRIYALGGYRYDAGKGQIIYFDGVLGATVEKDGHLSAWTKESSFSDARSGAAAVIVGNCLFVSGGSASNADAIRYFDDIQSAKIENDGRLSNWSRSPSHLVTARSNHSIVAVSNGKRTFLEVVAGVAQLGEDTVHLDTIETAEVKPGCEVGPWQSDHYHLKGGRSSPAALILNNKIVVIGGWGDIDLVDVYDDVQVTTPRQDGSPAPWRTSPSRLPSGIYGQATVEAPAAAKSGESLLMSIGGQPSTGVYANWISFAYALPEEDLADAISVWGIAPSGQLPSGRAGLGAALVRDRVYVIGGSEAGGKFDAEVLSAQFDAGEN